MIDVTEASKHGCEATARDDFIRAHVPGWHIRESPERRASTERLI